MLRCKAGSNRISTETIRFVDFAALVEDLTGDKQYLYRSLAYFLILSLLV
jgi:hypothetical protein